MNLANWLTNTATLSSPPPGSVNVLLGRKIEGPGGKWIPCATQSKDGSYYSGLFQVGPGQRQVCAASQPLHCPVEALTRATELACAAAA
jgi:hypothetical protein